MSSPLIQPWTTPPPSSSSIGRACLVSLASSHATLRHAESSRRRTCTDGWGAVALASAGHGYPGRRRRRPWLVTATTRLALDRLRRAKTERQLYTGPWLPEPLVEAVDPPGGVELERVESLSLSFLALLERLSPEERAAFLLNQVFDCATRKPRPCQIAEDTCRQRVHCARQRLRDGRPRFTHAPDVQQRLLEIPATHWKVPASNRCGRCLACGRRVRSARWRRQGHGDTLRLHGGERVVRLYAIIAQRYRNLAIKSRQWSTALALLTWVAVLTTVAWIETNEQKSRTLGIQLPRNSGKLARPEAVESAKEWCVLVPEGHCGHIPGEFVMSKRLSYLKYLKAIKPLFELSAALEQCAVGNRPLVELVLMSQMNTRDSGHGRGARCEPRRVPSSASTCCWYCRSVVLQRARMRGFRLGGGSDAPRRAWRARRSAIGAPGPSGEEESPEPHLLVISDQHLESQGT